MWSQALKNKLLHILTGSCSTFACPVLVTGACKSGCNFLFRYAQRNFFTVLRNIYVFYFGCSSLHFKFFTIPLFYASIKKALYPFIVSYISTLLATSHGECILWSATPQSITSILYCANI